MATALVQSIHRRYCNGQSPSIRVLGYTVQLGAKIKGRAGLFAKSRQHEITD
jgi:hypothetical protein